MSTTPNAGPVTPVLRPFNQGDVYAYADASASASICYLVRGERSLVVVLDGDSVYADFGEGLDVVASLHGVFNSQAVARLVGDAIIREHEVLAAAGRDYEVADCAGRYGLEVVS